MAFERTVEQRAVEALREDGHREPEPTTVIGERELALSLEQVLWLAVLGLAALVRLGALGRWPLSAGEAQVALAALGRALPEPVPVPEGMGPLAFNLTALSLWLFGPDDAVVRLPAALAGIALVGLLWAGRSVLGRDVALGAAFFVALSPALAFFSRQASEVSFAALCALWFVLALARYVRRPSRTGAWHVALALALGLTSGPGFWAVLAAGGLYAAYLWRRFVRHGDETWEQVLEAWQRAQPDRYRLLAAVLGVVAVVSTAGFTNPSGLMGALALPARWGQAVLGAGAPLVVPFSVTTFLYEWPLLLWATVGAALWSVQRPHLARFLLVWAFATFVPASLTNSGWAGGVAHTVLPLTLLAGAGLAALARSLAREARLEVEGLYTAAGLVVAFFAWLNLVGYSLKGTSVLAWLSFGAVLLLGGILVLVGTLHGLESALRVAGSVLLAASAFWALHTGWQLAYNHASDPREPLVVGATDVDVRYLPRFLRQVSEVRAGHPDKLPIAVQRTLGPVPRWYLRDFLDMRTTEGSHPDQPTVVLLEAAEPAPPGWIGQRVRLGLAWQWPGLTGPSLVRWLIYREAPGLTGVESILYIAVTPSNTAR